MRVVRQSRRGARQAQEVQRLQGRLLLLRDVPKGDFLSMPISQSQPLSLFLHIIVACVSCADTHRPLKGALEAAQEIVQGTVMCCALLSRSQEQTRTSLPVVFQSDIWPTSGTSRQSLHTNPYRSTDTESYQIPLLIHICPCIPSFFSFCLQFLLLSVDAVHEHSHVPPDSSEVS